MFKFIIIQFSFLTAMLSGTYTEEDFDKLKSHKNKYVIIVNSYSFKEYHLVAIENETDRYYDSLYECVESNNYEKFIVSNTKYKSTQKIICASVSDAIKLLGNKATWLYIKD